MKISIDQLARQLESDLGGEQLSLDPATLGVHCVDGKQPLLVCTPATPEQLAVALRHCADAGAVLVPWGGGTAMALGNPPRRVDVVISTARINRLMEHDHANLTVTAQSGMRVTALQAALFVQKQFLPFDPPFPERATIGGTVAANLNGPRRSHYGSLRDLVIGIKLVLGSGQEIKAGGKVVKNVAGYDMGKLFIGSLGTLGIITELTVRVSPIPECGATALNAGTLEQVFKLGNAVRNSKLLPSAMFARHDGDGRDWQIAVSFEGFEAAVARQLGDLEQLAQFVGMRGEVCQAHHEQQIWCSIRDFPLQPDRVIYRMTVPPAALAKVLDTILRWRADAPDPVICADLAMGAVWLSTASHRTITKDFADLIACARQHRGHAVIFRAPPELKTGMEVWGPSRPTLSLMRDIKQQFDPEGIMNLGRFVGGL